MLYRTDETAATITQRAEPNAKTASGTGSDSQWGWSRSQCQICHDTFMINGINCLETETCDIPFARRWDRLLKQLFKWFYCSSHNNGIPPPASGLKPAALKDKFSLTYSNCAHCARYMLWKSSFLEHLLSCNLPSLLQSVIFFACHNTIFKVFPLPFPSFVLVTSIVILLGTLYLHLPPSHFIFDIYLIKALLMSL